MSFGSDGLSDAQRRVLLARAKALVGDARYEQFVTAHGEAGVLRAVLQFDALSIKPQPGSEEVRRRELPRLSAIRNWLLVYGAVGLVVLVFSFSIRGEGFAFQWSWWFLLAAFPAGALIVGVFQLLAKWWDSLEELKNLIVACIWVPGAGAWLAHWLTSKEAYGWVVAEGVLYLFIIGPICWAMGGGAWRVNAVGSWVIGLGMIAVGMAVSAK